MRGKVAKFIRKICAGTDSNEKRVMKRLWNDTPRNKRTALKSKLTKEYIEKETA